MAPTPTPPRDIAVAALPSWRPEVVALDLDGTCIDNERNLQPRVAAAVAQAARNVNVVIATGRMYVSTLPWVQQLGITLPVICYQGALVQELPRADGKSGSAITEIYVARDVTNDVITTARQHGWHRQLYVNDAVVCEEDRAEAHEYARVASVPLSFVDDLTTLADRGVTKVVLVIDNEAAGNVAEADITALLGRRAAVVRSRPEFVEVTNPSATKGKALRRLCEHLGVDMAHLVAVGDAPNDIDMLAEAGFGIAIAGARDDVLDVADATCAPPEASGVATVLERFGLLD